MLQKKIIFTEHALLEMRRRSIDRELVANSVINPQQTLPAKNNRLIIHNQYVDAEQNRNMLLRIVIEKIDQSIIIITAYKTSKIEKYWRSR
ncbi:MAG: DUF4258 domain-containing protein [Candidatus Schekmanbacteria bacterium]|nr:DUF4258 domain-containing protein [Candidatus Schekmanbacteria bacterium]